MKRFGEKLRTLRNQHNMSLQDLANHLGFASRSSVADLQSGRLKPSLQIVIKIARLFNVSTDQLLFDELELD